MKIKKDGEVLAKKYTTYIEKPDTMLTITKDHAEVKTQSHVIGGASATA